MEASHEDQTLYGEQAELIERGRLMKAIRAFNDAVNNYKGGWQPQLTLELALMESLKPDEVVMVGAPYTASPQNVPQQPQAALPPVEATPPGSPPMVEISAVREKWMAMLKLIGQHNQTAPDLLQYFRVLRVDGNVVHLATDNQLYFERIQNPAQKLKLIEWGFSAVHKTPLRVKVILIPPGGDMSSPAEAPLSNVSIENDPLLSEGMQLGATITPIEPTDRQAEDKE